MRPSVESTADLLFTYGTLGPADADEAARGGWSADAVRGRLFDLGPYPALVDVDDPSAGWVEGHARPVEAGELEGWLDTYEGVAEGLYRRVLLTMRAGCRAWVYAYARALPEWARGPIARWNGPRLPSIRPHGQEELTVATATSPASATNRDGAAGATIGQYLIERLQALGLRHVFGIPGDYVLGLYKMLEASPIQLVGMTREDSAGFAADAYARVRGLGCVCVTYTVGGLSCANSIAGAYAEKSPVVVLSGSPGVRERERNPLLHHKVKGFETQHEVFQKITAATAVLDDPLTAFAEIDRVLGVAVRTKRPVYLEIPRDQLDLRMVGPHRPPTDTLPPSDPDALREALDEAEAMLRDAKRPMILADVEIHRFGLQDAMLALAEEANLPIATTILGKSVISEAHPLFVGVYEGGMGRQEVTDYVEGSDALLMLGCFLSDINLGIFTAQLDPRTSINATSEDLQIRYHHYRDVRLDDFINGLRARRLRLNPPPIPERPSAYREPWVPRPQGPVTTARLFARLNKLLDERTVVIADIGDALFGSADMTMTHRTDYISPAYYTSMGFGVPAAVGAGIALPESRVLVVVGDGAFQMTGMELSTIVRQGLNPIVVVMNNKGYTTERFLLEGSFNDIQDWAYHRVPEVLGAGRGFDVRNEGDLDAAVEAAVANAESFSLLNVHLDPYDRSPALDRLTKKLALRVRPNVAG